MTIMPVTIQAASVEAGQVKEINFVFLHGMAGNSSAMQRLNDSIEDQIQAYKTNYESTHPGITVKIDYLLRTYPNNVDIQSWAQNIADSVNHHFTNKKNLILIGHSMGGKTALYTVAHNIGGLADKVSMVVTINSPVKSLINSYYVGGDTALDYWGAQFLVADKGVLNSLINYDSSVDGKWVGTNKHWLAFASAESTPISSQFDVSGVDAVPRNMDDKIVPISSQYADGADVVYYGNYGHSDFSDSDIISNYLADQILRYVFGGTLECSVFTRAGSFEHKAGLLPGTDYWEDEVGGILAASGEINHRNSSFIWQTWEDVVGESLDYNQRSSYQLTVRKSVPFFTGLQQADWVSEDIQDGHLKITTRAAPGSNVDVVWNIYQKGLLPSDIIRDRWEVEIETGTPYSSITEIRWATEDPRDLRLVINSQANSPFRWFKANWRVYYKESRQKQIIDAMPVD
jgi:pimeloyl-ACP methyl ester carboxylesterase